tara:strand:- start:33 stop:170 length:138 start_codon:yes stop_codon:yes gene_type:complete
MKYRAEIDELIKELRNLLLLQKNRIKEILIGLEKKFYIQNKINKK